jgi:hypothetical protein
MADSFIQYQTPATPDTKLDSESHVINGQTVQRERIQTANFVSTANSSTATLGSGATRMGQIGTKA